MLHIILYDIIVYDFCIFAESLNNANITIRVYYDKFCLGLELN